ncbi:MAG: RuvX/YqgF family protein [Fimbriimonadaceae bacterium]|nr:RuvX/YqgF family protein [Fimbriimonadaceae bacterium]
MRVLGIDFGGTRIGLAVMDSDLLAPRAKPALAATGTLAKDAVALAREMDREECELAVIGLPLNEGEESRMSRVCRMLGERLAEQGRRVEFADEAMTSALAEADLAGNGLTAAGGRKRVDGEAAMRILLRWGAAREAG